jgi:hypothetical protein
MRAMMISFFPGHVPGRVKISGQNLGIGASLGEKVERASSVIKRDSSAIQHRGGHQDGVSDIDAYK